MKILSIQVGLPATISFNGSEVKSGIIKHPVAGPIFLHVEHLEGDGQADLRVHGGKDKALYAYSCDAYANWKKLRPQDAFSYGAMGENLSVDSFDERKICVGDTYELGEAVIQATQPRLPCFKLGIKFRDPHIVKEFFELGRPGVYFRVLKEGVINTGDHFRLLRSETPKLSIAEMFQIAHGETLSQKFIEEYLKIPSLPDNWKDKLRTQLSKN